MKKLTFKTIIGIDPGKSSGAIGIYRFSNMALIKMPGSFKDIMNELKMCSDPIVFIERVHHWAGEDPRKKMGIAKLVKNYNDCINACEALAIPYCRVSSSTWQSHLRIEKVKGEAYSQRKERLYKIALQKTNIVKVHKYAADAFLITLFGHHKLKSDQDWIRSNIENYGTYKELHGRYVGSRKS